MRKKINRAVAVLLVFVFTIGNAGVNNIVYAADTNGDGSIMEMEPKEDEWYEQKADMENISSVSSFDALSFNDQDAASGVHSAKNLQLASDVVKVQFADGDGTEENPYQVATAEQLNAIRNDMDACYIQIADIDLSGWNWEPIGYYIYNAMEDKYISDMFVGSYNGNGFKIYNLTIEQDNCVNQRIGLFGYCDGTFENIWVESCKIDIDLRSIVEKYLSVNAKEICIGGIVGFNGQNGIMKSCTITGNISTHNVYMASIGGITGTGKCIDSINYANINIIGIDYGDRSGMVYCGGITSGTGTVNGTVVNCINYGNIEASADTFLSCGGIAGEDGTVNKCINYGNISGEIIAYKGDRGGGGNCNVGGIVGATSSDHNQNCINYGNVSASKSCPQGICYAGGIVGYIGYYSAGHFSNSYNWGNSITNYSDGSVGRIAGYIATSISNCYSSGATLVNDTVPTENIGSDKINGATISENGDTDPENQTIRFGSSSTSFGEAISGDSGSIIETLLVLKSNEYTVDDLSILFSNSNVAEIDHIEKDVGAYIPALDGSEHIATVYIKLKDIGTSDIIIIAPDGVAKTAFITSTEAVYEIKLYSYIPTMIIRKGESIGAAVMLEKNGSEVMDDFSV